MNKIKAWCQQYNKATDTGMGSGVLRELVSFLDQEDRGSAQWGNVHVGLNAKHIEDVFKSAPVEEMRQVQFRQGMYYDWMLFGEGPRVLGDVANNAQCSSNWVMVSTSDDLHVSLSKHVVRLLNKNPRSWDVKEGWLSDCVDVFMQTEKWVAGLTDEAKKKIQQESIYVLEELTQLVKSSTWVLKNEHYPSTLELSVWEEGIKRKRLGKLKEAITLRGAKDQNESLLTQQRTVHLLGLLSCLSLPGVGGAGIGARMLKEFERIDTSKGAAFTGVRPDFEVLKDGLMGFESLLEGKAMSTMLEKAAKKSGHKKAQLLPEQTVKASSRSRL